MGYDINMSTKQAAQLVNVIGNPEPARRRKRNKGSFRKGDPRINRRGRPVKMERPKAHARVLLESGHIAAIVQRLHGHTFDGSQFRVVECRWDPVRGGLDVDIRFLTKSHFLRLPVILPGQELPVLRWHLSFRLAV